MSVIAPKERDDIETQFDHSQIYLYEMEANKAPVKRPRHCLPYAVVSWLKFNDGTEWPLNFNELLEITTTPNNQINGALSVHTNGLNGDHQPNNEEELSQTNSSSSSKVSPNEKQKTDENLVKTEPNTHLNRQDASENETHSNGGAESVLVKIESQEKELNNKDSAAAAAADVVAENPTENASKQTVTNEDTSAESRSSETVGAAAAEAATNDSNQQNTTINENISVVTSAPSSSNAVVPATTNTTTTTASPNAAAGASGVSNGGGGGVSPMTTNTHATNPYQHHKTSLNHYQKSSYSYRPNTANLTPYLYAAAAAAAAQGQHTAAGQQFHPYGAIRLPYGAAQQLQSLQGGGGAGAGAFHAANSYQAAAAAVAAAQQQQQQQQHQQQQQMFLIRTPNGIFFFAHFN
jgi:hypothetical protein